MEQVTDRQLKLGRKILLARQSHILSELRTVYRLAARGRMDWTAAGSAARILRTMREMLLSTELEERVALLEEEVAARRREPRAPVAVATNGHAADRGGGEARAP